MRLYGVNWYQLRGEESEGLIIQIWLYIPITYSRDKGLTEEKLLQLNQATVKTLASTA